MKKSFANLVLLLAAVLLCGCEADFFSDGRYRRMVEEDFKSRKDILSAADIDLDGMNLSRKERQAMEFLYAYMPLGDIVNRSAEYYLDHYHMAEYALQTMPWGPSVPEREFRHFVLPVRVNNENLDHSREVFQAELSARVKDMSMYDAVLEVNHWCHEKAVYMPSDRRTSSPLATVKTAYGRCGEESTLLVAALRSVGIPARQVYTPRWAHTDSNHAWVEAWVDGEWFFLGACEPEPVLNLGWFNAPASRGMLMHTKVFGRYDGPEDVVRIAPDHTEINVIDNYAPESAALTVMVKDADGRLVEDVPVEFKIYNYSNFETVATINTDENGESSLTAGLGDMLVFASKDGYFGFRKVTFGKENEIDVILKYKEGDELPHMDLDVVPPVENADLPNLTEEQKAANALRLAYEDSLRNAYVMTFHDMKTAHEFASNHGLSEDVAGLLVASRGNHDQIEAFILDANVAGRGADALNLLKSISEKDLRDTPKSVLDDHLYNTPVGADIKNVLCPRVDTELLTSYRSYFHDVVPESLADSVRNDPAYLVQWCRENLSLHDDMSLRYVQLEPARVWDTRLADKWSREIFFVAMCRSFGIPAWKDPITGTVKYEDGNGVCDVDFDAQTQMASPRGSLQMRFAGIPLLDDPKYKTHFTLSRYENGTFTLQNYSGSWSELFREARSMDCGYYLLTSGSRMSGGNVLAEMVFFTVDEGQTTVVDLIIRDASDQLRVIGNFNSESRYIKMPSPPASEKEGETSVLATTGRGYFAVALVDYGTEPTNHAFMDISAVSSQLEEWGRPLLVIFASEDDYMKFRSDHFDLPSTVTYGIDADGSIRKHIATEMKLDREGELPLVLIADTFNRVVFFSEGYTIGLGESLVKTSKSL